MELLKGDIIQGVVSDYASGGEGIIKTGNFPIFVPFAALGDELRVRLSFVKKDCAFGEIVEIVSPSQSRVKPRCPYFGKCGGCDLQHLDISSQLEIKRKSVKSALRRICGRDIDVPLPLRLNDFEYRNKLALPFGFNKKSGRISLGFYEKKSHKVVPLKFCPLHGEWAAKLIECVSAWANEFSLSVYDEETGQGLLRHVVARMLDTLSLTIVINGKALPYLDELALKLKVYFNDFALFVSVNRKNTNVIFGDDVKLVYGVEKPQNLGAFKAVVSPKSFLQVNSKVRDALYDDVAAALNDFDGNIVELFSGIGLLTAQLALRLPSAKITAVEIEPSASMDASKLAKNLGIESRVNCVCDDAVHYIENAQENFGKNPPNMLECEDKHLTLSPEKCGKNDKNCEKHCIKRTLILDPPRKGCDAKILEAAIGSFERIVYISCNPQTLARDLKILFESYELCDIKTYEMFPETSGIETLVVLKSKK